MDGMDLEIQVNDLEIHVYDFSILNLKSTEVDEKFVWIVNLYGQSGRA